MQNKTIVFKKPKEVSIEDVQVKQLKQGEALIQTIRSLISTGTELTILSGEFPPVSAWADYGRFPCIPGYSNVGIVVEVGQGVDRVLVGKRVASYGTHSAFATAAIDSVWRISDKVTDNQAAFFTIAHIVMNGIRHSQVCWGESVVVFGLGLLGQLTVQFLNVCGARPIIAVDVSEDRLNLLPQKVLL